MDWILWIVMIRKQFLNEMAWFLIRFNKNHKRGLYQTLRRQLYHCSTDSKKIRKSGHCSRYQRRNRVSKIGGLWCFWIRKSTIIYSRKWRKGSAKNSSKGSCWLGLIRFFLYCFKIILYFRTLKKKHAKNPSYLYWPVFSFKFYSIA